MTWTIRTKTIYFSSKGGHRKSRSEKKDEIYLEKKNTSRRGFTIDLQALRKSAGYIDPYYAKDKTDHDAAIRSVASPFLREIEKSVDEDLSSERKNLGPQKIHCYIPYLWGHDKSSRLKVLQRLEALSLLTEGGKRRQSGDEAR